MAICTEQVPRFALAVATEDPVGLTIRLDAHKWRRDAVRDLADQQRDAGETCTAISKLRKQLDDAIKLNCLIVLPKLSYLLHVHEQIGEPDGRAKVVEYVTDGKGEPLCDRKLVRLAADGDSDFRWHCRRERVHRVGRAIADVAIVVGRRYGRYLVVHDGVMT